MEKITKLNGLIQMKELRISLFQKIIEEANAELAEIIAERGSLLAARDKVEEDNRLAISAGRN